MTPYEPRGKALEALTYLAQLRAGGWVPAAVLANAIECDAVDLAAVMAAPLKHDLARCVRRVDGFTYWTRGDGSMVEPDDDRLLPKKQSIVEVRSVAQPEPADEPPAPELPAGHAIPLDQRRSVRVSLWPGGGIVIEGDKTRKLTLAQQGSLLDAIDRVRALA